MFLPNFLLCLATESTGKTHQDYPCTLAATTSTIQVNITSANQMPPNLAIALNGKSVDVDECSPKPWYWESSIKMDPDRTQAMIIFNLNSSPKNFNLYFPRGYEEPASNLMSLTIYDRDKCTDPHSLFQEVSDAKISWKPVYINGGKHCGVDAYRGESKIDL